MKTASLALLLVFALPYTANAATIHVPADQPTIQAAIDVAANGDTVLVAPGTYYEDIDFHGKVITVTSELGAAATVIDAGGKPTVVSFKSGETRNTILSGFTITGGRTIYSGAGISVSFSSPTIRDNIIAGNSGCSGVGIDSYFSSPRIENNTIARNIVSGSTGAWGIGIYVGGNSAAEIIGKRHHRQPRWSGDRRGSRALCRRQCGAHRQRHRAQCDRRSGAAADGAAAWRLRTSCRRRLSTT